MKKIATTITTLSLLAASVSSVAAETIQISPPKGALTSIPTIISAGISLILIVAGLIAFVYMLLGGIQWITSGGDKGAVEKARNQIIQAIIGIVVVFAAWGLIVLVQSMTNICLGFGCSLELPKFYQ